MDEFGTTLYEQYKSKYVTAILPEFTNLRGKEGPNDLDGDDDDEEAGPDAETVPGLIPPPAGHAAIADA